MSITSVYLDYNATTPVDPRVIEEMLPFFNAKFGNAASKSHRFGWEAEEAVEKAREQVANLIGAKPKEIIFTSGATESNNLALRGVVELDQEKPHHIVTAATEHKAMLDPLEDLMSVNVDSTILMANSEGLLNLKKLEEAFRDNTSLVSAMLANNETGVLQPLKDISDLAKQRGALLMTDATQAVGKIPVDVYGMGIDLMAFSGHKMYGPKGIGILYVRSKPKVALKAQQMGGGHERGMRSGTLNVPGIVGIGKACEICGEEMNEEKDRLKSLRDRLESSLLEISGTTVNGSKENRMAHVSNIAFDGCDAEQMTLSLNNVAVSHGSACTSAIKEPSHVLRAMGIPDERAMSSLRFSLGRFTTEEEIDFVIRRVKEVVNQLRG